MIPGDQRPRSAIDGRSFAYLAVLGAMGVAFALRSLTWPQVFPGDGTVLFQFGDGAYHARRALYTFARFPAVLTFDPFIAFPSGARIPMPPLYDWLLGGGARLFGSDPSTFEHVAAWTSPVLGAVTVWPVHAIGRGVAGAWAGVAAAWLYAVLPAASLLAGVGNPDHHAAVTLLAGLWLASSIAEARAVRPIAWRTLLHGVIVAGLLLSWSGSLLYLGLGEGARFAVAAIASGRPARLFAQAASAALAAGLVTPWLAAAGAPTAFRFASTDLSWLHVLALAALVLLSAATGALAVFRPEPRAARRALRAAVLAAAVALPLVALPPVRAGLVGGGTFVAGADEWAGTNPEQQPLFDATPSSLKRTALQRFGLFAWLVPLAPAFVLLRLRGPALQERLLLLAWSTVFALLALRQVRFAHDFAVPASAVFGWALAEVRARLAGRWSERLASLTVVAVVIAMLSPAVTAVHARRLRAAVRGAAPTSPADRLSPSASLAAFGRIIREATPEPAGFLAPGAHPAYGVLVPPSFGHSLLYTARRPVSANNFGPYLDPVKYRQVTAFYAAASEAEALGIVDELRAGYVVTADAAGLQAGSLVYRLHREDGAASANAPHIERLRLVAEGPPRGVPLPLQFPGGLPARSIPYKLFERVEGAVLEARGPRAARLVADLELVTNAGRRVRFVANGRAGDDGVAQLRVPYGTDGAGPTRAVGPWRGTFEGRPWTARVSEASVRAGAVAPIELQGEPRDGSPRP